MAGAGDIPDYLTRSPSADVPDPPVETAEQLLPFHQLKWEHFEQLCLRLAQAERDHAHVQPFGVRGQKQSGIDIYARRSPDEPYTTYQCKRYSNTITPADIKNAVTKFLDNEWAGKSDRFVLCVTQATSEKNLAREVETQAERLAQQAPSIIFEVWDTEQLSAKLKEEPELVREFFGSSWFDRFLPGAAQDDVRTQLTAMNESIRSPTRVIVVAWAPELLGEEIARFAKEDASRFTRIEQYVGTPPDADLVRTAIRTPPRWLKDDGDAGTWRLLALYAERDGSWEEASGAWQSAAQWVSEDHERANLLVAAAVTANVGGDHARHDELLEEAKRLSPRHPRVLLQETQERDDPEAVLNALADVRIDDRGVGALIEARKGLACLLIPDLVRAKAFYEDAKALNSEAAAVQGLGVNLVVQESRVALNAGQAVDSAELRRAGEKALEIRKKLLAQRRAHEASRLLMLAADALGMTGEFRQAAAVLAQAMPEELRAPDGPEVLGDAALRVGDYRLALRLTDGAATTEGVLRIRADSHLSLRVPSERQPALATLDRLVESGGDESQLAAFARLVASTGSSEIAWSDKAAEFLRRAGFERPVTTAQAFYLGQARRWDEALDLLKSHEGEAWAAITELRLAWMRKRGDGLVHAARKVLSFAPPPSIKLECGRALFLGRDLERAKETLLSVARDAARASALVRANAYLLLVRLVGDEEQNGELAFKLHAEWSSMRPNDSAASAWAPTVASRRKTAREVKAARGS